ncbi:MAG: trigger factor [Candidatus Scalindua rubra]|uniref:Trigger factor n=1 Tax=Candidatus Scalindua brodae TaxID=237368 RepID=A0A0B0EH44_9BACT|nr:MAG: trigger factor [Candidatus Scalindua brodae]MBZ0109613.1 trigger factor [Candidatus Scalindua rubra]TWU33133.1 Trigger factor [Candidatus Brocadiaceae bacterium S225]
MNIEIEEVGPCKKLLKFEIPKETIDDEWQKQLKEVARMANLPGFRKGKAPRKLLEKNYGDKIIDEVKRAVVSKSYQQAIEKNKLSPIGDPDIGDIGLELGKPLKFEITLEVLPTFELGEYKGMQLKRKPVSVTDEDIDKALTAISRQKAQLTVVKAGKIKVEDFIICDCEVGINGDVVWSDQEVEVMVSGFHVADIDVPDLKDSLVGAKSGDKVSLDVELGDNFSVEQHRNKSAKMEISIKEIKRPKNPEIDDELAKQVGYDSLGELKEFMTKRLEMEKKRMAEAEMQEQISSKLIEMADFEMPEDMIKHHTSERLYRYQLDLINKGTPQQEIEKHSEDLKSASEESVVRDFKMSLVLEHIAEKERIFVTEDDVNRRISEMAGMYGLDAAGMKKQLEKMNSMSNLRHQLRESKTLNLLMKEANIEEVKEEVKEVKKETKGKAKQNDK